MSGNTRPVKCQLCGHWFYQPYAETLCEDCVNTELTADVQAAFNQDLDDIKRDIAKHGVAY